MTVPGECSRALAVQVRALLSRSVLEVLATELLTRSVRVVRVKELVIRSLGLVVVPETLLDSRAHPPGYYSRKMQPSYPFVAPLAFA